MVGALVVSVRIELREPSTGGVSEEGLNEHAGASAGAGLTEHVSWTALVNPPTEVILTVEVADCPATIEAGTGPAADAEKSGVVKVAVTFWSAFMVTLHALVPEQAPLHPAKVDPFDSVAVSETAVPSSKGHRHVPVHSIPAGLMVTSPEPFPAKVTVSTGTGWAVLISTRITPSPWVVTITSGKPSPLMSPAAIEVA
jgi:hypothetical protein